VVWRVVIAVYLRAGSPDLDSNNPIRIEIVLVIERVQGVLNHASQIIDDAQL
jgi:hypothetical protein